MKTTLNADGKIGIPDEIREADHLSTGDAFELQPLATGHYLLTKEPPYLVAILSVLPKTDCLSFAVRTA